MARIDDADLVRNEYADETRLTQRFRAFREYLEGPSPEAMIVEIVRTAEPARILEVGCGEGQLALRMAAATSASVVAIDQSARMVELARARGVDTHVGDVQALELDDDSFDVVVASWMLYHVPDLEQGLREVRRVLRPGGLFVASTFGPPSLDELWDRVDDVSDASRPQLSFTPENGAQLLGHVFSDVSHRDADGQVVFPDWQAAHDYIAATITRGHLAGQLPRFEGELRTGSHHRIFIAR